MALTYQQAVEQTIIGAEQFHEIINGSATSEIVVEDGSKIPSVRKALIDNFYYKDPILWQQGQPELVFNQIRKFTDGTWWIAPNATATNPVVMGITPYGDPLWKVFSWDRVIDSQKANRKLIERSWAEAGYNVVAGSFQEGATLNTTTDVIINYGTDFGVYSWDGTLPKNVTANATPTGNISANQWVSVGDALSYTRVFNTLSLNTAAALLGSSSGHGVQSDIDSLVDFSEYNKKLDQTRSHKYNVLYEITHRFQGYDSVVSSGGYNYLYASGHTFDRIANELWIAYQADGGDSAQFYVVYDLTTMIQKTYFKCGIRWTKTFNLRYLGGQRYLYGRASNGYLAKFNVTTLPSSGGSISSSTQPKNNIGALFSSVMNDQLLVSHRGPTTNITTQFNTYLVIDPDTFEHRKVFRLNTVSAGDTDGNSDKMYKTQGLCFFSGGLAISNGGFVDQTDALIKPVNSDFRSIQGVVTRDSSGSVLNAGLFDPFKAMPIIAATGKTVNRFETEGLNFDEITGMLTTIWHVNGDPDSKFLIVEAFSASPTAIDLTTCSVSVLPEVKEVMSLYRDDQNISLPHDPVTGALLSDISDICNMMIRYDQREIVWYTSNFSTMTFNGSTLVGSALAVLTRGTNTTFFLTLRNTGVNQDWLIQVSSGIFSYTRMKMVANEYMFEGTASGDFIGNGSPEGVLTASAGSTYRNRLGGSGTTLYVKESGTGNTGWVGK